VNTEEFYWDIGRSSSGTRTKQIGPDKAGEIGLIGGYPGLIRCIRVLFFFPAQPLVQGEGFVDHAL